MRVLGLRCSNTDFAFALVTGTQDSPCLEDSRLIAYPKGYTRPQRLKWFLQELQEITRSRDIDKWVLKGTEPMAQKNKSFVERVEYEGIATLVAADASIADVRRKVKATIAKDFGLPGKAKSLTGGLDYHLIPNLRQQPDKIQEAVLVAWSELD